MSCICTSFT